MNFKNISEIADNVVHSKFEFESKYSSLVEGVLKKLNENGSKVAMVDCDSGRQWMASEMFDAILTLGLQFADLGIENGDIVTFFCPNSDYHVIAMLAVMSIGGVYNGLIHRNPLREVQYVVDSTGACYLVGCTENIDICNELLSKSTTLKKLFLIDGHIPNEDLVSISNLLKNKLKPEPKERLFASVSKMKLDQMIKTNFSSGTTGLPKAVIYTNKNCLANQTLTGQGFEFLTPDDCAACIAHTGHGGGSSILYMSLLTGSKCAIFSHFESQYFVENVQKHSITFAFLVPSYVNLMNKEILEPIDSFKLKKVLIAGEVLPKRIGDQFIEKFKPEYFGQGYGSSEMGWATAKPSFDGVNNILTSGLPLNGYKIKIVNLETGKTVGVKQKGEILIKGPQLSPGYLNNNIANEDSFDKNGFFKTGDLGYIDENGYLYVVERIKDTLKYNGLQVSVTELQYILFEHESVKEASVIGIEDEIYGQLPKAFVVLKKKFKNSIKENDLLQFVNERVADHKKLRGGLVFMDSLPKSILGKIDKKALKSM